MPSQGASLARTLSGLLAMSGAVLVNAIPLPSELYAVLTNPANRWAENTVISFYNSTEFWNATERWSTFDAPTFAAAVRPTTAEDVVTAVRLANEYDIPFLATGGRHSWDISLGELQWGLAIDLRQLNSVEADPETMTMTIGGGVQFDAIFDPMYAAGMQIQTGSASCPGMVGVTIGGGIGRYQGFYGLVIDALESVTMVTADGRLINVTNTTEPELFWGLKGAGANFGVITSATYNAHTLVNEGNILNVDMMFAPNQSEAYFNLLEQVSANGSLPEALAIVTAIAYNTETNEPYILANWVYNGPQEEGMQAIQPALDLKPSISNASMVQWNQLTEAAGFGVIDQANCADDLIHDVYAHNLRNISGSTFQQIFQTMETFWQQYPDGQQSAVLLEIFPNQAMSSISSETAPYPFRDTLAYISVSFVWESLDSPVSGVTPTLGPEIRDMMATTSGYPPLSVFVNYAHGDEPLETIFGVENIPRLAALKRTWDPQNRFAYSHSLPIWEF